MIFSAGGEMKFGDSGQEAELLIPALGVTFPKEGKYNLILRVGNYPYGSRRMIVNRIEPSQIGGG